MAAINNLREWQSPPAMPLPTQTHIYVHMYDGGICVCVCVWVSAFLDPRTAKWHLQLFFNPAIPPRGGESDRESSCRGRTSLFALRMHFSVGNKFSKKNSKSSVNNWRHFRTQLVRFRERGRDGGRTQPCWDLCRSIKVLFTQSTMLDKGRRREGGSGLVSCGLRPYSFSRGVVAPSVPSQSDNKKQFATHWALTTTNDNRQLPLSPSPCHSLPLLLTVWVSVCLPRIRACCSFVTNATIWPNGPSGLRA